MVNETKTMRTIMERCTEKIDKKYRYKRKLESLLGDSEDITKRKQPSKIAHKDLEQLWIL